VLNLSGNSYKKGFSGLRPPSSHRKETKKQSCSKELSDGSDENTKVGLIETEVVVDHFNSFALLCFFASLR
jgi:hypothetical protein